MPCRGVDWTSPGGHGGALPVRQPCPELRWPREAGGWTHGAHRLPHGATRLPMGRPMFPMGPTVQPGGSNRPPHGASQRTRGATIRPMGPTVRPMGSTFPPRRAVALPHGSIGQRGQVSRLRDRSRVILHRSRVTRTGFLFKGNRFHETMGRSRAARSGSLLSEIGCT